MVPRYHRGRKIYWMFNAERELYLHKQVDEGAFSKIHSVNICSTGMLLVSTFEHFLKVCRPFPSVVDCEMAHWSFGVMLSLGTEE